MQLLYNQSDPMMEESSYKIESIRRFAGLKLNKPIPDETTILNFRRLLEAHNLCYVVFTEINAHLQAQGLSFSKGAVLTLRLYRHLAPSKTGRGHVIRTCIKPRTATNGTLV